MVGEIRGQLIVIWSKMDHNMDDGVCLLGLEKFKWAHACPVAKIKRPTD